MENQIQITDKQMQALTREFGHKKPIPFPVGLDILGNTINGYQSASTRHIAGWLYATGQRITEALETKREDVSFEEGVDGKPYMVVNSICLKAKDRLRRVIPVPIEKPEAVLLDADYIDYIRLLKPHLYVIDNRSRNAIYNQLAKVSIHLKAVRPQDKQIIQTSIPLHPHYFRHCRASHLANQGFDLVKLMNFFGWASPAMVTTYVNMSWTSLAEGFRKAEK